jgi:cbb3-type cytochrome oxidase maturation protein
MNSLFFLLPISALLVLIALRAFWWAVHHDQFENLDRAARQALDNDD